MQPQDHTRFREWIDRRADGELSEGESVLLEAHLTSCPDCRRELAERRKLEEVLAASRVAVRDGFVTDVLRRLPGAGWEARSPRSWGWAVGVLLALLGAGAGLGSLQAPPADAPSPLFTALATVGDVLRTSLLAGAGLLAASWKGVGMGVADVLRGSPVNLGAFTLVVLCLNLLLVRLIRRRMGATERSSPSRRGRGWRRHR